MKKNTQNKAFTLIELLVVISIISLLASILLPKLQQARAKADDVRRKAVLKNIQSQIIGDKADATTNFSDIFSSGSKAKDMLDTLISQTGVSSTDYDAKVSSDGTSYAVVFPLKADPTKYWCVDSTGVSKEVGGRLTLSSSAIGCKNIPSENLLTGATEVQFSGVISGFNNGCLVDAACGILVTSGSQTYTVWYYEYIRSGGGFGGGLMMFLDIFPKAYASGRVIGNVTFQSDPNRTNDYEYLRSLPLGTPVDIYAAEEVPGEQYSIIIGDAMAYYIHAHD